MQRKRPSPNNATEYSSPIGATKTTPEKVSPFDWLPDELVDVILRLVIAPQEGALLSDRISADSCADSTDEVSFFSAVIMNYRRVCILNVRLQNILSKIQLRWITLYMAIEYAGCFIGLYRCEKIERARLYEVCRFLAYTKAEQTLRRQEIHQYVQENEIIVRHEEAGRPYKRRVSMKKLRKLKLGDEHQRLRSLLSAHACLENRRKRVEKRYRDMWYALPGGILSGVAISSEFCMERLLAEKLTPAKQEKIQMQYGSITYTTYRWCRTADSLIFSTVKDI